MTKLKVSKFYSIKDLPLKKHKGKPGIYFWGFSFDTLKPNKQFEVEPNKFIIYYIGKSNKNTTERMMQHVAMLFGGYYPIISKDYLANNIFSARISDIHNGDINKYKKLQYKVDKLETLLPFIINKRQSLSNTIDWMKSNLIYAKIDMPGREINEIERLEKDLHHAALTNILGIGQLNNIKYLKHPENNDTLNSINWAKNEELYNWLINTSYHFDIYTIDRSDKNFNKLWKSNKKSKYVRVKSKSKNDIIKELKIFSGHKNLTQEEVDKYFTKVFTGPPILISAHYGNREKMEDCTDTLKMKNWLGKKVSNELMGTDPSPRKRKFAILIIKCFYEGKVQNIKIEIPEYKIIEFRNKNLKNG